MKVQTRKLRNAGLTLIEVTLVIAVLLGLIVGSFLNVLIHRLPRMLEVAWEADHAAWLLAQQDVLSGLRHHTVRSRHNKDRTINFGGT